MLLRKKNQMFTKILCSLLFIFVFRNPSQAQTGCFLCIFEWESTNLYLTSVQLRRVIFDSSCVLNGSLLNSWAGVERSIGLEHLICPISSLLCEKLPYYLLHLVTTPGTGPDCSLMCQPPPPCLDEPFTLSWFSAWRYKYQGLGFQLFSNLKAMGTFQPVSYLTLWHYLSLLTTRSLFLETPLSHVSGRIPLLTCLLPSWLFFLVLSSDSSPLSTHPVSTCCLPQESVIGVPYIHTLSHRVTSGQSVWAWRHSCHIEQC